MYIFRFLFLKNIIYQGFFDNLFGRDGLFHYLCFQKTIRFYLSFLCNICENWGGLGRVTPGLPLRYKMVPKREAKLSVRYYAKKTQ